MMKTTMVVALFICLISGSGMLAAHVENSDAREAGYAVQLHNLVNQYRLRHDLPQLQLDAHLTKLAQEHNWSMAKQGQLSHDGFEGRFQRAHSALCVENVGWNYRTVEAQLEAWRGSAAHDVNLLNADVQRVGIAVFKGYVTFFACTA